MQICLKFKLKIILQRRDRNKPPHQMTSIINKLLLGKLLGYSAVKEIFTCSHIASLNK